MLTLALPKSRLFGPTLARLAAAGVVPDADPAASRALAIDATGPAGSPLASVRILLLKDPDVPVYVERGVADAGVAGTDQVRESGCDVMQPLDLAFGGCRIVLASRTADSFPPEAATRRGRMVVATKYPRIATELLGRTGVRVEIVRVAGSVEAAAVTGLADAIVDLVESGATLRANELTERATLLPVTAELVVNRAAWILRAAAIGALITALEPPADAVATAGAEVPR